MIKIKESQVQEAAAQGTESFVALFCDSIMESVGGRLTDETMPLLSADQITLLAYWLMRRELLEGGFVQLIHNGYGPFIFHNPFGRALNGWGLKDLRNLIYDARRLYDQYGEALERDCSDEEFMALYEQYEEFDALDDTFVEQETEWTDKVAHYVDDHLSLFAEIVD